MIREFECHIAWVDVMREGATYIGLIEYQRKLPSPLFQSWVQVLWVLKGKVMVESEAENAAMHMLDQISEITPAGKIIYKDGVAL